MGRYVGETVEHHERGGESEKVAAGRQEGGRVGVQGEGTSSLSRIDVDKVEVIDVELFISLMVIYRS